MAISQDSPKIVVMGAGAIGGTVAGHLAEAGEDVTAVTRNTRVADAVRRSGFKLAYGGERRVVRGRIEDRVPAGETFDLALLATQPSQVEEAARSVLPYLREDAHIVCFQNGLCEARVARIAGAARVVGGIVSWGASMPEPGLYERTAAGGFTLGTLEGGLDAVLGDIGTRLETIGPVAYTENLQGARFSKLALNCAISSLGTLAGERLGGLVRVRAYRRLALEIFTEAAAVADSEGVRLEKVAGTLDLSWVALSDAERARGASAGLAAKHGLLMAVGFRYRKLRSSMLAAIERGRDPGVEFLNGEIAQRGDACGVPARVNAAVADAVREIARGERKPCRANLDQIYREQIAAPVAA